MVMRIRNIRHRIGQHLRKLSRTRLVEVRGWDREGNEVSAKVKGKIEK
ncbi:MAG: hypothetical protein ABIH20_04560 [Candidatus Diapherotrites archaeon]